MGCPLALEPRFNSCRLARIHQSLGTYFTESLAESQALRTWRAETMLLARAGGKASFPDLIRDRLWCTHSSLRTQPACERGVKLLRSALIAATIRNAAQALLGVA